MVSYIENQMESEKKKTLSESITSKHGCKVQDQYSKINYPSRYGQQSEVDF
jgi:hypothetical protein